MPLDSGEIWLSALADATRRLVRVVVIADSMGELSLGYQEVWKTIHSMVTLAQGSSWMPPRAMAGAYSWPLLPGEEAAIGIEGRGQLLRQGDGPAGSVSELSVPTTLDVYYTARPDGAPLDVIVDGEVVLTIDTSLDESGERVDSPIFGQRGRTPRIASAARWQVEAVGPGVAAVESVCIPPLVGLEVHGTGRSGVPTRELLDAGCAIGHLRAMVGRGEPPDLVVWAADTADQPRALDTSAVEEALDLTREMVPSAAIAHYIPTGHNQRADWEEWAEAFRRVDRSRGVIVIDGLEALGDVSAGAPNERYSKDGAHLNREGQAAMNKAWLEVLAPAAPQVLPMSSWTGALERSSDEPARVVLVADDLGVRSGGLSGVWDALAEACGAGGVGRWYPAGSDADGAPWRVRSGEPADLGLDGAGVVLRAADGPVGTTRPVPVPTRLDLYYTARPDGAVLRITVDDVVATLDTSIDEQGRPVREPRPSQRWRSPELARAVKWTLEVLGEGVAAIEAVGAPPLDGVEVHGVGGSGRSASAVLERSWVFGHIEAMIDRGEPPALVVWAGETSAPDDAEEAMSGLNRALLRTRSLLPNTSIAVYIPPGHVGRTRWGRRSAFMRLVAEHWNAIAVDGEAVLGDISPGSPGSRYSNDGLHLNAEGQAILDGAFRGALGLPDRAGSVAGGLTQILASRPSQ